MQCELHNYTARQVRFFCRTNNVVYVTKTYLCLLVALVSVHVNTFKNLFLSLAVRLQTELSYVTMIFPKMRDDLEKRFIHMLHRVSASLQYVKMQIWSKSSAAAAVTTVAS